jgi:hypothetical protein
LLWCVTSESALGFEVTGFDYECDFFVKCLGLCDHHDKICHRHDKESTVTGWLSSAHGQHAPCAVSAGGRSLAVTRAVVSFCEDIGKVGDSEFAASIESSISG